MSGLQNSIYKRTGYALKFMLLPDVKFLSNVPEGNPISAWEFVDFGRTFCRIRDRCCQMLSLLNSACQQRCLIDVN